MLVDRFKSDVLDTNSDNALLITESEVELFLLVDLEDVEVTTAGSASQDSGDEGTVPDGSAVVVTGTALQEFSRGEEGKDWLVLAGGEVGDLVDLVDLVVFLAEFVESLGPWEFAVLFLAAGFKGFRGVLLSQALVISASQGVTLVGVGSRFGGLLSSGLVLSLVLEGRLVRTGLTDGVVGLALSVDGLLHGLKEEARVVVLVFTTE